LLSIWFYLRTYCKDEYILKFVFITIFGCVQDSNTYEMALMVEPLLRLQDRVNLLLKEWPEHPGLQQILQINGTLLGISLNSPLMKVRFFVQGSKSQLYFWSLQNTVWIIYFSDCTLILTNIKHAFCKLSLVCNFCSIDHNNGRKMLQECFLYQVFKVLVWWKFFAFISVGTHRLINLCRWTQSIVIFSESVEEDWIWMLAYFAGCSPATARGWCWEGQL